MNNRLDKGAWGIRMVVPAYLGKNM